MKATAPIIVVLLSLALARGVPAQPASDRGRVCSAGVPASSALPDHPEPAPKPSTRLLFDLAEAYEREGQWQDAFLVYQRAAEALRDPQTMQEARLATSAQQAALRLRADIQGEPLPRWGQALVLALTVLLASTLSQLWRLRRRRRTGGHPVPVRRVDDPPMRAASSSDLFDRRLGYLRRVLDEPLAVARAIQDPMLAQRLRQGRLASNTHLFACAAALEEVEKGKTFDSRPSNTYGAYLRPRFKRKGWAWPKGVEAWSAFFDGGLR